MVTTIRITPTTIGDEIYLYVFMDGAEERVGPVRDDEELLVILEKPEVKPLRQPPGKAVRRVSQRQERRIAEDIGGRTQPGSGNQPGRKSDVRKQGSDRVEAKFTFARQYTIKLQDLRKVLSEAQPGEAAALQVDFVDKNTKRTTDSWVLVPYQDWLKGKK